MTALATCAAPGCGVTFRPQRSTARYCSARCRKAAFLACHSREDSVPAPVGQDDAIVGVPGVPGQAVKPLELGLVLPPTRLGGDTLPDRKWRVREVGGWLALECEAMVPGGWLELTAEPTATELRRSAGWLGLRLPDLSR